MKHGALFFIATLLLSNAASAGSYIVKLKEGSIGNFMNSNSRAVSDMRQINVSHGEYLAIETPEFMVEDIKNSPEVEYIEPNYTYTISPIFNDQQTNLTEMANLTLNDRDYRKQWGLKNTGRNSGSVFTRGKKGEDINAEKAWEITKGSKDVIVAVIDTGVDYKHKDLKDNMWTNSAELNGIAGVDDDGNGYVDDIHGYGFGGGSSDPMDKNGHGTHCAGVIGATHNNRIGGVGVMANVKIMALRFINGNSGTTEDAILAIEYGIKNGANLMSNSWGGDEDSKALKDAIIAAGKAGITFVVAAGNSHSDNDSRKTFPASYDIDSMISVGAIDAKGNRSYFSNYAKNSVHVMAPGSKIYSTWKGGGYKSISGTSMAAPFVSGMVGLLLSSEPNLTPLEIRKRMIKTSVKNGLLKNDSVSNGRVDAYRMLTNSL